MVFPMGSIIVIIITGSLIILMSLGLGLVAAASRGSPRSRATIVAAASAFAMGLALLSGALIGYDGIVGLVVQIVFWGMALLGIVVEVRLLGRIAREPARLTESHQPLELR